MNYRVQTAGVVIYQNGKYLLVQEKNPKVYGQWCVPAGHIDEGETPEEAAVRETLEETGYQIELDAKIGEYEDGDRLRHAFVAHITGGELTPPPSEVLTADWLSFDEVTRLNNEGKLRSFWVMAAIEAAEASS